MRRVRNMATKEISEAEIEKLVIANVNGSTYFGTIIQTKDETILEGIDRLDFKEYVKARNLGELKTTTFKGNGTITTRFLTDEEKIQMLVYIKKMAMIKKTALAHVENDLFQKSF
jgi:hypothetical protein